MRSSLLISDRLVAPSIDPPYLVSPRTAPFFPHVNPRLKVRFSLWAARSTNTLVLLSVTTGSKAKQSRKEKEAELAEVIAELALQVDIKGSCRKPTLDDQPVVILAKLPYYTAT